MPHLPRQISSGGLSRILSVRFLFVLALVLICIVNMSWILSLYSRGADGTYPITHLKSPALVYLPFAGAAGSDLCACYSPPSSPLDDVAVFSSGIAPALFMTSIKRILLTLCTPIQFVALALPLPPLSMWSCAKSPRSLTATSCAIHHPPTSTRNQHKPPVERTEAAVPGMAARALPRLMLHFFHLEFQSLALQCPAADLD
jgi:hypothetical protein